MFLAGYMEPFAEFYYGLYMLKSRINQAKDSWVKGCRIWPQIMVIKPNFEQNIKASDEFICLVIGNHYIVMICGQIQQGAVGLGSETFFRVGSGPWNMGLQTKLLGIAQANFNKECVAVLTVFYKENGAVSCVGSDFLSAWVLYLARTWPIVVRFAQNKNLSGINPGNIIDF